MMEVRNKLESWKVQPAVLEKIINELVEKDFLNEERFVRMYIGSKLRINHWGINKIMYELKKKQVPELFVQIGIGEIDHDEYQSILKEIISKKEATLPEKDPIKRKQKLANYAIGKGFSAGLVWKVLG